MKCKYYREILVDGLVIPCIIVLSWRLSEVKPLKSSVRTAGDLVKIRKVNISLHPLTLLYISLHQLTSLYISLYQFISVYFHLHQFTPVYITLHQFTFICISLHHPFPYQCKRPTRIQNQHAVRILFAHVTGKMVYDWGFLSSSIKMIMKYLKIGHCCFLSDSASLNNSYFKRPMRGRENISWNNRRKSR